MLLPLVLLQTFFVSTLAPAELQGKQAVLETSHGTIVLDLLGDVAPNHVAHFITRAREGAYDGTTFHRVIAMGIIQGGDPISKDPAQAAKYGTGGLGVLRFEPNSEKHTRGAVSAVLIPNRPDSAGTQFFVCLSDQPSLTGKYTIFGEVTSGMDVADKIGATVVDGDKAAVRVEIKKVLLRTAGE
jgi:peptidyl-prolyl cis-trans isomerase B (cyclophilin B)